MSAKSYLIALIKKQITALTAIDEDQFIFSAPTRSELNPAWNEVKVSCSDGNRFAPFTYRYNYLNLSYLTVTLGMRAIETTRVLDKDRWLVLVGKKVNMHVPVWDVDELTCDITGDSVVIKPTSTSLLYRGELIIKLHALSKDTLSLLSHTDDLIEDFTDRRVDYGFQTLWADTTNDCVVDSNGRVSEWIAYRKDFSTYTLLDQAISQPLTFTPAQRKTSGYFKSFEERPYLYLNATVNADQLPLESLRVYGDESDTVLLWQSKETLGPGLSTSRIPLIYPQQRIEASLGVDGGQGSISIYGTVSQLYSYKQDVAEYRPALNQDGSRLILQGTQRLETAQELTYNRHCSFGLWVNRQDLFNAVSGSTELLQLYTGLKNNFKVVFNHLTRLLVVSVPTQQGTRIIENTFPIDQASAEELVGVHITTASESLTLMVDKTLYAIPLVDGIQAVNCGMRLGGRSNTTVQVRGAYWLPWSHNLYSLRALMDH